MIQYQQPLKRRGKIGLFFIFFILMTTQVFASRISILPQPGVKTLGNHLTDADNNFKELYRLIFVGESGFTGISGNIITSGTISAARIDSAIARTADILLLLDDKIDYPSGDGTLFLSDDGTYKAAGGGTDWDLNDDTDIDDAFIPPGIARIANLPVAGTDYLTPSAVSSAITSAIASKQDASTAATDSELTVGLAGKQNADADLTTFAGITPSANILSILTAADYPAVRTLLGLRPGTDFYSLSATDTLLSSKQNADSDLTTFAGITPSANVISLLGAANYAAARALLDLEAGTDFYSISAADTLFGNKQNLDADLTDLADGSLTGSKIGAGISAANVTTGTLPDAVIPVAIIRNTDLTTALSSYTTSSALTTLLAGKMGTATGTPDGTKFLRDDMTWQTVVGGAGDDWDVNNDSVIDIGYLPSALIVDTELTTALSNYTTSSALTTLLNGKVSIPTGDGSLFYSNDGTYKAVSSDDWDGNNDSVIDTVYLPTALIVDTELTATLSNYVLTSTLSSYVTASSLTTTLANYIQTGSNASFGTVTANGPITSTGGADGTRGIWFSSPNTIVPNTTTYPDGIYLGATSLIGRYAGVDYDLLAAGGSGSVAVDSTVVTNPNFDSNGSIDMSVSGSNISASVKNNVITTGNLTTDTLVTSSETVPNTDTAILTAAAINKLIDHKVNEKLSASGFTIVNLLNPLTSPTNVSNSSYTVSGDVYDAGTTPVVTVSLNSGTYESATVTGSTSPWTWSRLLTLISGNNTIDVRVTASDNDIINLPQAIVNYTPTDTTNPVVGVITPSSLTHPGTGVTLTASINSIIESNEDYRQWSLYDVTDSAIEVGWTTFTGLSITGISIPADQHTYRVDVRVYDLAGNVGTASSDSVVYSAPVSALMHWSADSATVLDTPSDRGITAVGGAGVGTYAGRQAANADGYERYFTVATPTDLLSTDHFDIEIDVYIPAGSTGGIVFRLEGLSGGEAFQIGVTPTGISCYYATSSNHAYTTTVSANAWHTVRWRFNTSTNSSIVSLDATDNTTTITENMTTSYTGMTLGGRSGYDGFDGYFDEVYSHAVD